MRSAGLAARTRSSSNRVTQGQLDRQDGVCLHLLGSAIRAFENAHDRDPSIPRLAPIATRRMFDRKSPVRKEASPRKLGGDGAAPK